MKYRAIPAFALLCKSTKAVVDCKVNTRPLKEGPAEFDKDFKLLEAEGAWFEDNQFGGPGATGAKDHKGSDLLARNDNLKFPWLQADYAKYSAELTTRSAGGHTDYAADYITDRLQEEYRKSVLWYQKPRYQDVEMGKKSPEYFLAALTSVVYAGDNIVSLFENVRIQAYALSPNSGVSAREVNLPGIWGIRLYIRGKPWILTIDDRVPFDVKGVVAFPTAAAPDPKETCTGAYAGGAAWVNCDGYRGKQSKTISGQTCQAWDVDTPNARTHCQTLDVMDQKLKYIDLGRRWRNVP